MDKIGGFDDGVKSGQTVIVQTADFKKSLEQYQKQVEDFSIKIKDAQAELQETLVKLDKSKVDLQAQYAKQVSDLGDKIALLNSEAVDLQAKNTALDSQIKDKQETRDAIILDFTDKQRQVDEAWEAIKKSQSDMRDAEIVLGEDQAKVASGLAQLNADRKSFEAYKEEQTAILDQKEVAIETERKNAESDKSDAADLLRRSNEILNTTTQARVDLEARVVTAQGIIDQADDVQKKAEETAVLVKSTNKQALQNQQDATEIKVARIALNNLKQQLDAREQTLRQAEQAIGGK
jgi:chromosome segregation ATPase